VGIERLVKAGMDVARLNFSHGSHDGHAAVITEIKRIREKLNRPLAILQDLSGPKVRLGTFLTPVIALKKGSVVELDGATNQTDSCPDAIPLPVPELLKALKPGSVLLLDDGKIALKVVSVNDTDSEGRGRTVRARVTAGGELKPHKGVTAPGLSFSLPAVTEKDKSDLRFGLAAGVDMIAASYVRSADDILPLLQVMQEEGRTVPIVAKIEKFEAVKNLGEILKVVDAIMVARGDLGVEMPFDEVPIVQKKIIQACNLAGKPVITATQMLESMISCPRPTRAEATDVANAILDGTDAVMLSGETASGMYPEIAVKTMAQIAARAEAALLSGSANRDRLGAARDVTTAVARATAEIAIEIGAKAILCATSSGSTARRVSQYRPSLPIIGVTTELATYRFLALVWGINPVLVNEVHDTEAMMDTTINAATSTGIVKQGDQVVLTAGVPVNRPGHTNLLKVHVIGDPIRAISEGDAL
jgi:pyruvate kinase